MTVEFKYKLDQGVNTPFGDKGIVAMLAFDGGGKTYYVKTSNIESWYKEEELS